MKEEEHNATNCQASISAVKDSLYVLNGKWKLPVIIALSEGPKRFKELERAIEGISPRVLSKELRELELNEFIERKVYDEIPVRINYELTPYSDSLKEIIGSLVEWGQKHRKHIMGKKKKNSKEILVLK
ncbi:MAG TPA: helix-turn-helix domain-containing protein [Edaphocola sp.]|nr:helix-turn-helix domain-containing protein [Edaphocola sp.]